MARQAKFWLLNTKIALQQTSYPTRQAIRLSKLTLSLAKLGYTVWPDWLAKYGLYVQGELNVAVWDLECGK